MELFLLDFNVFESEGLPRFEGIETHGIPPFFKMVYSSEGLPRFEGIETDPGSSIESPSYGSEGLPRFEGIETPSFLFLRANRYLVRRLAPI